MSEIGTLAKNAILASIRSNLAASEPIQSIDSQHRETTTEVKFHSDDLPIRSDHLIEMFRENLEAVGGKCTIVSNQSEATSHFRSLIASLGLEMIAISDSELVRRVADRIDESQIIEGASVDELFACDLGVTEAQLAIAETGTLVLVSDREQSRLTSLVPPIHMCLLRSSGIRQTMREILELTKADLSAAITFVTGASRTSDIELTLAIGVHGPRELHVIILDD